MPSQNPPWLDALLAQAYPDSGAYGRALAESTPQRTGAEINQPLGGWTTNQPGSVPSGGIGSDARFPSMNVDPRLLPASPVSPAVPGSHIRPIAGPPRPNPSNVGGAPSPGIPAPLGANRTGNNLNPNYSLVQYGAGGVGRGGQNAPIYTAGNFGGPQNAGWGQQAQAPQAPQQPRGALANPQGGGSGLNVSQLFSKLPDNTFDNSQAPDMSNAPWGMGPLQQGMNWPSEVGPDYRDWVASRSGNQ